MPTPANDETKPGDKKTPPAGTKPPKDADSVAPKKTTRKRRAKKTLSPPAGTTNKTVKNEKSPTDKHANTPKINKPKQQTHENTNTKTTTEAQKKPNVDIKSDTYMLPGIDNINEYIARKKASGGPLPEHKEITVSLTAADGTDLRTLPGLYAIVPHKKGGHKLVYMQTDAPAGLIDDPKTRTPGKMYVKNGHNIYMVMLTIKEHPTLKDSNGVAYDVWIIDRPEQLTDQINAIKQGRGGGENFGEVMLLSGGEKSVQETGVPTDASTDITQEASLPNTNLTPEPDHTEHTPESSEGLEEKTQEAYPAPEISETALDPIDLNLPLDDELPEIDTDQVLSEIPFPDTIPEEESTHTITLDMEPTPAQENIEQETSQEPTLTATQEKHPDAITLDIVTSELPEEHTEPTDLHDTPPELVSVHTETEISPSPEEPSSLFLPAEERAVSLPEPEEELQPETAHMFRVPGTPEEKNTPASSAEISTPPQQPTGVENALDLDDLHIESPAPTEQSIDLDSLPISGPTSPTSTGSTPPSKTIAQHHALPQKSNFPFPIIIRLVLFLLITGALILVRKVMFPAIKGTKPVDQNTTTTGQLIEENREQPTTGNTLPPLDPEENPAPPPGTLEPTDTTDVNTPPIGTPQPPPENIGDIADASLTLNELTKKLQAQQSEARKLLNIAKLLEDKQAIKFSLAAMLKAGNVLDRIETETTITAQDVLQESQKIDRYLKDANKLIE